MGTARYMSPEQARGERVGPPSDVFSLGIILYQMATGQHPFAADSFLGTLHAIVAETRRRRRMSNPAIATVARQPHSRDVGQGCGEAAHRRRRRSRTGPVSSCPGRETATHPRTTSAGHLRDGVVVAPPRLGGRRGDRLWQRRPRAPALTDNDVLVLADFTNGTGEPVFDGTLREALAVQLERSPFLKVMDDAQVRTDSPV